MKPLRNSAPTPRTAASNPIYPRLLGAGLAMAISGCGFNVIDATDAAATPPDGDVDAKPPPERDAGTKDTASEEPVFAGLPPPPWDAEPDAVDEDPPFGGIAPPPYDGGDEDEDADDPEGGPQLAGY